MRSIAVEAPRAETPTTGAYVGWVLPAGIVVLGALLRLYHLGAWNLELDEVTSAVTAAQPLGTIWGYILRTDPYHPPLYHFFLHFWRALGDNDWALRFPSLIFSVISITMVYRIGTYLVDRPVGLLAALLLAVSPFQVWYGQEARMYAALLLLSLVSLDALARLIREDRASQWLIYVGATTLGLYTDYGAILVLAAQNVAFVTLATLRQAPRLSKWILAQGVILVSYLPLVMQVARRFNEHSLWRVPFGPYTESPSSILLPPFLQRIVWVLVNFSSAFLPGRQPLLKLAVLLLFGAVAVVGVWALRRQRISWVLLTAFTTVPLAVGLMLSIKMQVLFPRTVIPASAGYYVLIAAGLLAIRQRPLRLLLGAGLLAANALSLDLIYFHIAKSPPWSQIAAHLTSEARPGEGILFADDQWGWVFGHYYHGPGELDPLAADDPGDLGRMLRFAEGHRALFLVMNKDARVDPQERVREYVRAHFTRTERLEFPGNVAIEHYRR